jgi:hypothetical protein
MGLGEAVGAGDQHQGPLPEVLLLMVLGEAGPQITRLAHVYPPVVIACVFPDQHIDAHLAALLHGQEVGQQTTGHFDHLHDAGGDLGDADAVGLAAGQEDLDGLGCLAHAALAWGCVGLLCSGTVLAIGRRELAADQGEEGPQSGSVGGGGVELDSGGKHSR